MNTHLKTESDQAYRRMNIIIYMWLMILGMVVMGSCAVRAHAEDAVGMETIYSFLFENREALYKECKEKYEPFVKKYEYISDEEYVIVANINLMNREKGDFKGSEFTMKIKKCEDIPQHSVCINDHYCFIKYKHENNEDN